MEPSLPAVRGLRDKYRELLALRVEHARGESHAPQLRMRALARRFPGALRELDELPLEVIEQRLRALDDALAQGAPFAAWPWIGLQVGYHAWLREALRVKRLARGRRREALEEVLAELLAEPSAEPHGDAGDPDAPRLDREAVAVILFSLPVAGSALGCWARSPASPASTQRPCAVHCSWADARPPNRSWKTTQLCLIGTLPGRNVSQCAYPVRRCRSRQRWRWGRWRRPRCCWRRRRHRRQHSTRWARPDRRAADRACPDAAARAGPARAGGRGRGGARAQDRRARRGRRAPAARAARGRSGRPYRDGPARRCGAAGAGGPGGRSLDAEVQVGAKPNPSYARAVALAAEDLRDTSIELSRTEGVVEAALAPDEPVTGDGSLPAAHPAHTAASGPAVDRAEEPPQVEGSGLFGGGVDPLIYVRAYGGASTDSEAPATGVGAGVGLCVHRHCLVLGAEMPLLLPGHSLDVRYRYPTFTSGFYSQPLVFGQFALGGSLGFLTRVGHFRADMGLRDEGLDTDLGARGSVELAYTPAAGFDILAETGADYTIDRHQLATGEHLLRRGDRFSPWGQLALRVRP